MSEYPQILPASKLIGGKVVSTSGEELGTLKELMLDPEEGSIVYAVLSFGGFLGLKNKLFAIPWEAFMINPDNSSLILNIDKEVLRKAPGFDKDEWPAAADYEAGWLLDVYQYYGYSPYWIPTSDK